MTKPSQEVVQSVLEILADAKVDIALSKYDTLSQRCSYPLENLSPYPLYVLNNRTLMGELSEGVDFSPSGSYLGLVIQQRELIFKVDIFPVKYNNNLVWQIKDGLSSVVRGIESHLTHTDFEIEKEGRLHRFALHHGYETGPKFDFTFIPLEFYEKLRQGER